MTYETSKKVGSVYIDSTGALAYSYATPEDAIKILEAIHNREEQYREQIAKEIEDAPHHHNMLQPCDGCKDKEFYLQVIRKELPYDTR